MSAGGKGGPQWEWGVARGRLLPEKTWPHGAEGLAGEGHPKKDCVGVVPTSPPCTRKHAPCCIGETLSSE